MKHGKLLAVLAILAISANTLRAQQTSGNGGSTASNAASTAAAAAADPASAAAAASPQAGGIVGLVQLIGAEMKKCKAKMCACPLGQLLTNMMKPMNLFAGGLFCPPCCPPIKEDDLKKPSTSPQGACAKIMQSQMESQERRKAIQCLANFDCHWWPEAEAALITGLRTDTSECVRLEAALTLGTGCCCTKKTIEALTITVSGSKRDGNPSENSPRVKEAAFASLQRCLACYTEEDAEPHRPEKPEKPGGEKASTTGLDADMQHLAYYVEIGRRPSEPLLANARRLVASMTPPQPQNETVAAPTGRRNLYQIWVNAQKLPADSRQAPRQPALATSGGSRPAGVVAPAPTILPATFRPQSPPPNVRIELRE